MKLTQLVFSFILINFFITDFSDARAMIQHMPFEQGMCTICHTEGADGKPIPDSFTASQPDMCYTCHERKDKGMASVHPALQMDCTMCHNPHESEFKSLLKDKVENVCSMCHGDKAADLNGRPYNVKHSALIMTKSCVRCHNPHSSDNEKLLVQETPQLCSSCHATVDKALNDPASNIHPAVYMGCQNCHSPHGSNSAKLLKIPDNQSLNAMCFTCHDKNSTTFAGGHPQRNHPVEGPKDKIFPDKQFNCISCHKPHTSKNEKLLRYNFKKAPYNGKICSVCHWNIFIPPPAPPKPGWND